MICEKCGTELRDNPKFCPKCGCEIDTKWESKQNIKSIIKVVGIVAIVLFVAVFLIKSVYDGIQANKPENKFAKTVQEFVDKIMQVLMKKQKN